MPAKKRKNKTTSSKGIEKSPLLARDMSSSTENSTALHSTIHPERFDIARFTDRKDQGDGDESSFRIIIYVLVVIIVGVGLALVVRQVISNNSTNGDETEQTQEQTDNTQEGQPDQTSSKITIDTDTIKTDEVIAPANEDYFDSGIASIGSPSVDASTVSLSGINYVKHTTYSKLTYKFTGLTGNQYPSITINFNETRDELVLKLPESMQITEEFHEMIEVGDLVTTIEFNADTNEYTIDLSESSKYKAEATVGQGLIIYLKTDTQFAIDAGEEVPTETEDTTATDTETQTEDTTTQEDTTQTTTDTQAPTGLSKNNDFSQSKQYVSSNLTGNTISMDKVFYEDTANYFEIAWGQKDAAGDDYVPNASAELITNGGNTYIELQISNLKTDAFTRANKTSFTADQIGADLSIDLSAANFTKVELVSFTNGTAIYRVYLKNKADFRLASETTVSGNTQVLSLQIKD